MLRKILLPSIFILLGYGFWISPDFKEITAGVAIFLFGMLFLEEGFKAFTGGTLESVLKKTTNKLWKSLSFGVLSTTIMQSSSLVSVITISFLSAGLIGLAEGIGIIFGANLGTTTGAWLVAGFGLKVKISAYAMPMLVFGIILVFQSSKALKGIGYVLAGLGFLFLGIHHMKEGFEAFKDSIDLAAYAIPGLKGLLVFTGIGIFATVVMQSSHATLVLIITALAAQQITYENALALAIGANVGTTITAILGAMSSNVQGRRLAGAHLIFNMVTGLIAILFIGQFLQAVNAVSAAVGIADDDYTLKLAVFHTLFNLVGILVMLPFTNKLVNFLEKIMKERARLVSEPRYLNESAMEMPDAAARAVRNELKHLFDNASKVIADTLNLSSDELRSEKPIEEIVAASTKIEKIDVDASYEQRIKSLYNEIVTFITKAQALAGGQNSDEFHTLRVASLDIAEAIKNVKHLQKNLVVYLMSDNPDIRRQYNEIRTNMARVLREIHEIAEDADPQMAMLSLDTIKVEIAEDDILANGELDRLIREDLISAEMATSLMNDSAYAYDAAENLIAMAHKVFTPMEVAMRDLEEELMLSEGEIDAVAADDISDSRQPETANP